MNKKIIRLFTIYTAFLLPSIFVVDILVFIGALAFIVSSLSIFIIISTITQRKFKKRKAFFYPFGLYAIIDAVFLVNGVFINPSEMGFGLIVALFLIIVTIATLPFYYAIDSNFEE